jgi:OOP family OmpA-OmpF porin
MKLTAIITAFTAGCVIASAAVASDLSGAKDSPLVSRFKGAQIVGYRHLDFGKAVFPAGPMMNSAFPKSRSASGRLTAIAYSVPQGKGTAEVLENYRQGLQSAGFKIVYSCHAGREAEGGACGGYAFGTAYVDPVVERMRGDKSLMVSTLDATNGDVSYLVATIDRADSRATVGVVAGQDDGKLNVVALVQIVEETSMVKGQVSVDASAMGKSLASSGKVELYGLHFATDSDKLEADSKPTLDEMAKALKAAPALKVFIVGHTDNSGSLAHNLELSKKRAQAVVNALHITYSISMDRLAATGLASYSPVAPNTSDAAKAKNRRVEMVAQ